MVALKNRIYYIIAVVALLLLIPLIAMKFTNEVNWKPFDFVVAGILLLSTGLTIDFILQKVKSTNHRILLIAIVILVLLLIWAELAVGIFNSPLAGN